MLARSLSVSVAVLALLAGCGSSDGGSGDSEPPSLAEVAAELGCTDVKEREPAMFARQTGECNTSKDRVSVSTFSSKDARDSFVDTAKKVGSGKIDQGDLWVSISRFREGGDTPAGGDSSDGDDTTPEASGRPSVKELENALRADTSVFGDAIPDASVGCVAEVLVESPLSDATLRAVAAGDNDYTGSPGDQAALEGLTSKFGACVTSSAG